MADEKNKAAKKEEKAAKKAEKKEQKANKPKDPEVKKAVIKGIAAVACVGIISASISSSFGKIADAKLAVLETGSEEESADAAMDDFFADFDTDDGSAAPAGDNTTPAGDNAAAPTDDGTAAPADDGTAAPAGDSTTPADSGKADGKAPAASKIPSTKAEILKVYNDATAKAAKAAVPFQKDRTTTGKLDAGATLTAMKDIVYKFMGVGDANKYSKTVTAEDKDSYHKYLQASKLTEADITNATCRQSGDNYLITINIKDGSSSVSGGKVVSSNNSPLDRSGLACGDNDKDYWDHKTAENVMSAIDEVPGCGGANINESYKGAVINVVINAKTGNIVQLGASFSFSFNLDKVLASKGTAEAATTIVCKDFKY